MRDYEIERDAIVQRWYGHNWFHAQREGRTWPNPIDLNDYVGVPSPANSPFDYVAQGECLVWVHALNAEGYGRLIIEGKTLQAHRIAYIQATEEIPAGLQINHLCNRPYCVQPAHLYAGTKQDNADDARMFKSRSMLSPVAQIMLFPDAEYDDPLLQRLRASDRLNMVKPWKSPVPYKQTAFEEFECPGHDFSIPAGDGAVCRICERFKGEDERSLGYHIAVIGKEIYPVSQLINSILNKVVNLDLAGDDWKDWRERCYYRAGMSVVGDDHNLRNCGCMFCLFDRQTIRKHLESSLTPNESAILDICDQMEPIIRQHIREMRRETFEGNFSLGDYDFTDRQKGELIDHIDDCDNTLREARNAAHMVERLLGYYLYAVVTYDSLDIFAENDTYFKYWRPFRPFPLPENQTEALGLCATNATKTCAAIFDHLSSVADEFVLTHQNLESDGAGKMLEFTKFLVATDLCDVLTYDLFGSSSNSQVFPLPHQGCVEDVVGISA